MKRFKKFLKSSVIVFTAAALLPSVSLAEAPTVYDLVSQLTDLVDPIGYGRHDFHPTRKSYSTDMVKEFLKDAHGYSSIDEVEREYEIVEWHEGPIADQYRKAGTITLRSARAELKGAFEGWIFEFEPYVDVTDEEKQKIWQLADKLLKTLKSKGVYFGFDGTAQNSCAAPTQFLLILDPNDKKAYGIDLNPCSES